MRLLRAAVAMAAMFLAAGCLPVTSKTPVGTTAGLDADEALTGTWIGRAEDQEDKSRKKDKGVLYLHFLKDKDAGGFSVLWAATGDGKDNGEWMSFKVGTARLGTNRYMNAVETGKDGKPVDGALKDASFPLLYSFGRHHRLTLYMLDEDKVKAAIKAAKIAGTVESGDYGDVKITAEPAALDAFMATPEAAALFKVFIVLKRAE